VSNTPFRRHKTWVHEGGIATPLIVHWPQGIAARGELRHTPGHVIDLAPTIFELAGGKQDSLPSADRPSWPGRSLAPAFGRDVDLSREYLWWLHEGNRAIRVGDWKLVAAKDEPWELFNLKADRAETNNVAGQHAGKVSELEQAWTQHWGEFRTLALKDAPPEPKAKRKARKSAAP
jgi:arylsulfatase